tara:strand:+ start:136 stop:441 length:306 start_codon:yes stop_codon:yes gene_type:complete
LILLPPNHLTGLSDDIWWGQVQLDSILGEKRREQFSECFRSFAFLSCDEEGRITDLKVFLIEPKRDMPIRAVTPRKRTGLAPVPFEPDDSGSCNAKLIKPM